MIFLLFFIPFFLFYLKTVFKMPKTISASKLGAKHQMTGKNKQQWSIINANRVFNILQIKSVI